MPRPFRDRIDAGRQLVPSLVRMGLSDPLVLALPRGGVPTASEVASALRAPLEVFVVRKVGMPGQPELGIGAVAEGGTLVADQGALGRLGLSDAEFSALVAQEQRELDRRVRHYRGDRPVPDVEGRDVVVVDDGLATGVTADAALVALRAGEPHRLVLAVPVCASQTADRLRDVADDLVCVHSTTNLGAVGFWYDDFRPTSDGDVLRFLDRAEPATNGR